MLFLKTPVYNNYIPKSFASTNKIIDINTNTYNFLKDSLIPEKRDSLFTLIVPPQTTVLLSRFILWREQGNEISILQIDDTNKDTTTYKEVEVINKFNNKSKGFPVRYIYWYDYKDKSAIDWYWIHTETILGL